MRPIRAPDPARNPLVDAPPPVLPAKNKGGRPPKPGSEAWKRQQQQAAAAPAQAGPAPEAPPAAAWPPADPGERQRILDEQRPQAELIVELSSVLAARLPPHRPLSDFEKAAIVAPLQECLAKWMQTTTPEGKLLLAVGAIALQRFVEVKLQEAITAAEAPQAPPRAAPASSVVLSTAERVA